MSDDVCGHPTADGTPCQHPASDGDSCWLPSHGGTAKSDGGRPTKLNLQRQEEIAAHVEEGKSFSLACRKAGITPQTGIRWLQEGEDEDEGPFNEFFERITRAKGVGQEVWEDRLLEVAEDPATILSILRSQYSDAWGDAERGKQAGDVSIQIERKIEKAVNAADNR